MEEALDLSCDRLVMMMMMMMMMMIIHIVHMAFRNEMQNLECNKWKLCDFRVRFAGS